MKKILTKILAIGLLFAVAAGSLQSQTNTPTVTTNPPTEIERKMAQDRMEFELKKAEIERSAARDKIDAEKNISINKTDKNWNVLHDIAWNSWVVFAIAIFFFGYLKNKRRHETIRMMVEKGVPVTPEIITALRRRSRLGTSKYDPSGYLAWGITLVAVGIGVLIVAGKAGWIVLLIGVADLILWVIEFATRDRGQTPR